MPTPTLRKMKQAVAWVEIPARDIERAKNFYQKIFEIKMRDMNMGDFKMAMFPVDEGGVGGALCEHPDFYHPGEEGPLIYLNANPDLETVLNKVEKSGGKILQHKKKITDEYGFMAIFRDPEGNRMALHSMK